MNLSEIRVIPLDMVKMNKDINTASHMMEEKYGEEMVFSVRPTFGVIEGKNILIETDCFMRIGEEVELDIYQDQKEGDKTTRFGLLCEYSTQAKVSTLIEIYGQDVVSLKEFMGRDYAYNERIKNNMNELIEEIGK